MILAVDPGVRGCGCALFANGPGEVGALAGSGSLLRAAYVTSGEKEGQRARAWVPMVWAVAGWVAQYHDPKQITDAAIEFPKVYRGSKQKGDPADLLELAAIVGALCVTLPTGSATRVYLPHEHKGQTPKEIMHARAMKRLSPEEISRIELPRAKSLAHNVYDAVQIGLVHLRRM